MSRRRTYSITVSHSGLNKYRVLTGTDYWLLKRKADLLSTEWNAKWQRTLEKQEAQSQKQQLDEERRAHAEEKRLEKQQIAETRQAKSQQALQETNEARAELQALDSILAQTLLVKADADWGSLKDTSAFAEPAPTRLPPVREPAPMDAKYRPKLSVIDQLSASRRQKKVDEARDEFERDHKAWEEQQAAADQAYDEAQKQWDQECEAFFAHQQEVNASIDRRQEEYLRQDSGAVVDYCEMVLSISDYPNYFPMEFVLDYVPDTKTLGVDYQLPPLESLPRIKEVKYISARDEFKETLISETELTRIYDSVLYQIVLRSVHELFEADVVDALDAIVFNGWVQSVDQGTGQEVNVCILSLHTTKKEFTKINLAQVDPKICFKNLKGIGSPKLHSLTPVAPILQLNREDPRFVQAYEVLHRVDEGTNLAAMDWEDFEHLIREVFEKEFAANGGEVKITQASRDRGVDAVAFDPDPIPRRQDCDSGQAIHERCGCFSGPRPLRNSHE